VAADIIVSTIICIASVITGAAALKMMTYTTARYLFEADLWFVH
jgi:hypothetical protein